MSKEIFNTQYSTFNVGLGRISAFKDQKVIQPLQGYIETFLFPPDFVRSYAWLNSFGLNAIQSRGFGLTNAYSIGTKTMVIEVVKVRRT